MGDRDERSTRSLERLVDDVERRLHSSDEAESSKRVGLALGRLQRLGDDVLFVGREPQAIDLAHVHVSLRELVPDAVDAPVEALYCVVYDVLGVAREFQAKEGAADIHPHRLAPFFHVPLGNPDVGFGSVPHRFDLAERIERYDAANTETEERLQVAEPGDVARLNAALRIDDRTVDRRYHSERTLR